MKVVFTGGMEPNYASSRRSFVQLTKIASVAVALLALAACGSQTTKEASADGSPKSTERPVPTDITCSSGYSGGTDGGEYPEESPPEGYATPEAAAQVWLDAAYPQAEYLIVDDGLLVLRDDGTATARAFWLEGRDDYVVDGYRACAPAPRG